ncbi:MAG: phosphoribosylglycinamide formyltransferase [Candidatus Omnitrophota bacterium]
MKNIAVFASGFGSNLRAILDHIASGELRAKLALVVSDKSDAFALKRAKKAGVKTLFADPKKFATKDAYEKFIIGHLKKEKVHLLVLSGFMRIVGPTLIRQYKNRILNIHPALLPSFKGAHAIQDAFRYGASVTGVTVHLVDEKVDHGPIVMQEPLEVCATESLAKLEKRIHRLEHKLYSKAIAKILSGRWSVRGRKVIFTSK